MQFVIITPVFNGERFIDETIISVLSQSGPFRIRYHVQDGGSTDGTLSKLATWERLIREGFPVLCEGLTFTYASEPDRGVYDAINKGFGRFDLGRFGAMTWINADDMLDPKACRTVQAVMERFPDVAWIGGRISLLDEDGFLTHQYYPGRFPRRAVAAGIFDGRHNDQKTLIQQEGTFWRPALWQHVGGIDADRYRLAGDFELWRRFAAHAEYVAVDRPLGFFRRRAGQLSGDLARYHAEIDANLTAEEKEERSRMAALYGRSRRFKDAVANDLTWRVVTYEHDKDGWHMDTHPQKRRKRRTKFWQVWRPR